MRLHSLMTLKICRYKKTIYRPKKIKVIHARLRMPLSGWSEAFQVYAKPIADFVRDQNVVPMYFQ